MGTSTNTCFVAILLSSFIHLMSTVRHQVPTLPPSVGSCRPLGNTEILIIAGISSGKPISNVRHRVVCEVPGILPGTISQVSVLIRYDCFKCPETIYQQFNLKCHKETSYFTDPNLQPIRGTLVDDINFDFYSLKKRTDCGECANFSPGYGNQQHCGGMNIINVYCIV